MQMPGFDCTRQAASPQPANVADRYTVLIFWPHTRGQRLKSVIRKIERQIAHSGASTTLIIYRDALRRGEGKLRCIHSPILLGFQLITAALIVLLHRAKLMDRAITSHVNGELLQIAIAGFRRQDKVIAILFDIVLLPVAGLVAGNQHKRRITGGIFQPKLP